MDKQYRLTPYSVDKTPVDHDLKWGCITEGGIAAYLLARVRRTTETPLRHFWARLLGNAVPWGSYAGPTAGSFTNYAQLIDGTGTGEELLWVELQNTMIEAYVGSGYGNCLYYTRIPTGDLRHHLMTKMATEPAFQRPFGYHCKGSDSMSGAWTSAGKFCLPPWTHMEWAIVNLSTNPRIITTDFMMCQHELDCYDPAIPADAAAIVEMLRKQRRVNHINGHLEAYQVNAQNFGKMFTVPQVLVQKDTIYYYRGSKRVILYEKPVKKGVRS